MPSGENKAKDLFSKPAAEPEPKKVVLETKASKAQEEAAAEAIKDAEGFAPAPPIKVEKEVNLDDLNESTLLKYPIVAKALNEAPMVLIKPKDSSVIFHWVFYDRSATGQTARVVAANVQRYKFWGFQFATIDDIQGGEEALADGMFDDGGQITNYDTVLMKIDKIRLMSHYKKNLLDSLIMTDGSLLKAIKSAENDVVQSGTYSKAMREHPKAKIEFYTPLG